MSGRRSHARFAISPTPEGVLRVVRDVAVRREQPGEMIVVSREPGVIDERLVLEIPGQEGASGLHVQVAESRPMMVDGSVRHRVRLRILVGADLAGADLAEADLAEADLVGPDLRSAHTRVHDHDSTPAKHPERREA